MIKVTIKGRTFQISVNAHGMFFVQDAKQEDGNLTDPTLEGLKKKLLKLVNKKTYTEVEKLKKLTAVYNKAKEDLETFKKDHKFDKSRLEGE